MSDFDDFDDDLDLTPEFLEELDRVEAANNEPPLNTAQDSDSFSEFDDFDPEALIRLADTAEISTSSDTFQQSNTLDVHNHSVKNIPQSQLTSFFGSPIITHRRSSAAVISPIRQTRSPAQQSTNRSSLVYGEISHLEEDQEPPQPPSPEAQTFHPFDRDALPTWVYPTNYPIRSYQYSIIKKAIFTNTLVALPTGLGKTFIAAVVMYNYYRWFPSAKIIFMAPTRPLVTQQIEACFNVCGLPQKDTVDMTGGMNPPKRKEMWRTKRVFFLTPQVLQNDLKSRICPADQIVCIVVDEAHKATGNYAYTETVKLILKTHDQFRVLALTATPGTNIEKVQVVLDNLRIANVEIRTEDSMDIREYSFGKSIRTIIVRLDEGEGIVQNAIRTFRNEVFTPLLRRLTKFQAIYDEAPERNTPFQLMMARKEFSMNAKNFSPAVKSMVQTDFSIGDGLSRAYDMLCQHGVGPFLTSIDQTLQDIQTVIDSGKHVPKEKAKLLSDFKLKNLLRNLRNNYDRPDFVGHPKINSLIHSIKHHFENNQTSSIGHTNTKVIVFSSYRSSVEEIVKVLSKHQPLIRCCSFIGQASGKNGTKGLNQKEQQEVVSKFKQGEINVIVATSIGEEGLDIGEVDLIVCYDSQSSPIRMLQRIGRTGRKRQGQCILLMTEQEERKYQKAKDSYNSVQRAIAQKNLLTYFKKNPYILPENYKPVCCKKKLNIGSYIKTISKKGKNGGLQNSTSNPDGTLRPEILSDFIKKFQTGVYNFESLDSIRTRYWPLANPLEGSSKYTISDVYPNPHKFVGHSYRTNQFINIINNIHYRKRHPGESERVNIDKEMVPQGVLYQKSLFKENKLFLPSRQPIIRNDLSIGPKVYSTAGDIKPAATNDKDDNEKFLQSLGPFATRGILNASDDEIDQPWDMFLEDSFEGLVTKNKGKQRELPRIQTSKKIPVDNSEKDFHVNSYNVTFTSADYKEYEQKQEAYCHSDMILDYEPILPDTQEMPITHSPEIHQFKHVTEPEHQNKPREPDTVKRLNIIDTKLTKSNSDNYTKPSPKSNELNSLVNPEKTKSESFDFNDWLPKIRKQNTNTDPKKSLTTSNEFAWNISFPILSTQGIEISEKRRVHYKILVANALQINSITQINTYHGKDNLFPQEIDSPIEKIDESLLGQDLLDQLFNSPIRLSPSKSPISALYVQTNCSQLGTKDNDELDDFEFSIDESDLKYFVDRPNDIDHVIESNVETRNNNEYIEKPILIRSQSILTEELEEACQDFEEGHHEKKKPVFTRGNLADDYVDYNALDEDVHIINETETTPEPEIYSDILPPSPPLGLYPTSVSPSVHPENYFPPEASTPLFKTPIRMEYSEASEESPLRLKIRSRGLKRPYSLDSPNQPSGTIKRRGPVTIILDESEEETTRSDLPEPRKLKRLKRASDNTKVIQSNIKKSKKNGSENGRKKETIVLEEDNPFLDVEAERSSDEFSTDDGENEEANEDESMLNSFINDGSSAISYQSSQGRGGSVNYGQDPMAMYRASLFSPETLKLRKEMGFR
ncbi:hypothetical protein F4703DRAFT_1884568 [Phycomyces blakesleeanus]